jgi:hypothetical protein
MAKKTKDRSGTPSRKEQRATLAARRRRSRLKTAAWVGGIAALLVLVVFLAVNRAVNRPGEPVPDMGNMHIEEGSSSPLAYNSTPPTSGPHYGSLARWGVHGEPIPDELQVHNLEDGGVGVWYDCPDDCPELVSQLDSVVDRYHEGVLMAPYPGMDTRIALTAWNRIDQFDEFDEERVVRFIRAFSGADHHAR